MKTDHPAPHHIHQLRSLWQNAFGDTDDFLDCFFRTAYAPDHCLCVLMEDQIAAVLYWIDCTLNDQKLAYIYAVVTHPAHRGKGLCRRLLSDTHALLTSHGYAGAILVPQKESLRQMYAGMGYRDVGGLSVFSCEAGSDAIAVQAIGSEEFSILRRKRLPEGSVIQDGTGLAFLSEQLQFYAGSDFLLAAYAEKGTLHGVELLGNRDLCPGIVTALGCSRGTFRMPGREMPFAMFHPLSDNCISPDYFGFAFD